MNPDSLPKVSTFLSHFLPFFSPAISFSVTFCSRFPIFNQLMLLVMYLLMLSNIHISG